MLNKVDSPISSTQEKEQKHTEAKMKPLVNKYPEIFKEIGKVKLPPIHIYRHKTWKQTIAQKLRLVALHLIKPLQNHLEYLVKGDVIKGLLDTEFAVVG